jgi:diaminohydroxyphosphoribosylaminopyrimidine deaminase/5-amino-6-(5-phosphoribosylamino)uracil reductase
MAEREVQHVLVEGGARIHTTAVEENEADKLMLFVAPLLLGGDGAPGFFGGRGLERPDQAYPVRDLSVRRSGSDILVEGYLKRS